MLTILVFLASWRGTEREQDLGHRLPPYTDPDHPPVEGFGRVVGTQSVGQGGRKTPRHVSRDWEWGPGRCLPTPGGGGQLRHWEI